MWLAVFIAVAAATLWLTTWMVHKARQTCGPPPLPFLGNLLHYVFAGNGHMKVHRHTLASSVGINQSIHHLT